MRPMPPVSRLFVRDRSVWALRDDLVALPGLSDVSGNKARKLRGLAQLPAAELSAVLSCGGANSNMLPPLSALCRARGWQLHYATRAVPVDCRQQGNFAAAARHGFRHLQLSTEQYRQLQQSGGPGLRDELGVPASALWLPQGGASPLAQTGCRELGEQLTELAAGRGLLAAVPCGTGTTALLAAEAAGPDVRVLAVPCVGSASQLQAQMERLAATCGLSGRWRERLEVLEHKGRVGFGHPSKRVLAAWQELAGAGLAVDLVYGAAAWDVLLRHDELWPGRDGSQLVYVHTGGMSGHATQLQRYQRRGWL